ncbi:MAG: hypothetical protein JNJ58_02560 [Chitinophagaceae bacterium]|nr:hypothetical protein [Chitinophagaceae bacterium]
MYQRSIIVLGILIVFAFACKHTTISPTTNPNGNNGGGGGNGGSSTNCSPDTVYFTNDILPIMISNCTMSGCHNAADHKEGVILTDYNNIMATSDVEPGNPSSSDLYKVLIKTDPDKIMPRPPMSPLTAAQIAMVKKWIEQGAKNNSCTSCDTSGEMKFAANVQPILQANCTGCHSASSPGGGINLSDYPGVSVVVNNGKLIGSITHAGGFSAMPKNGNKLSDCHISQIQKWINNGAQNN